MKGCISISLYGTDPKYVFGAVENARLAHRIYPGWTTIFHTERGHVAIPALLREGAEVVEHAPVPGSGGMFWRFEPMDDLRFTHLIIRDADSRLNVRERACVDAWIASGKPLHIMRDNWWHTQKPIIAGAWGVAPGSAGPVRTDLASWPHTFEYGDDEHYLGTVIRPRFSDDETLVHCYEPETLGGLPVPAHPPYEGFVCEPIVTTPSFNFRAVVLSPEHYANRREQFFKSLDEHGGFLRGKVDWHRGKTAKERVVPTHVDHAIAHPHYHLASRDHIDIIERAILDDVEYLFVFEDDARFTPYFEEYFLRMWVALPDGWRAAMLGGQDGTNHARRLTDPPHPECIAEVHGCLGMHGVLWSREGMLRAFDHFTYWNRCTVDQAFRGLQGEDPGRYFAPAKWIVEIDPDVKQFGLSD